MRPTYKTIANLIRHCPFLRFLAMTIRDADAPLTTSDIESLPRSNHLQCLQLRDSVFADVDSTIVWLERIVPFYAEIIGGSQRGADGGSGEKFASPGAGLDSELQQLASAVTTIGENLRKRYV